MIVGARSVSPIYTGDNYKEIINSFPFYITRDDQSLMEPAAFYSIRRREGKPSICSGHDPETKAVHFFTNIGVLNLEVGERLEFMEVE